MDLQIDQLRTLVAVVDHGTLDAAARELRVTPSAVSQRLKALESSVGQVLVRRSRPARPTEPGTVVLRVARQMILLNDTAGVELAGAGAEGATTIPVVINGDSLNTWALQALAEVDPEQRISFEVHRADEGLSVELLRNGTVMAAVTSVAEPVPGCSVRRLGTMGYRPMASPGYVERWFPDGPTIAALAVAPVVVFDRDDTLQDRYLRRRTRRRLDPPRHFIPVSADFARAIALGLGWGMVPPQQSRVFEDTGCLVEFDPPAHVDVPLYWQQWKLHTPMLDQLADAMISTAARELR
ncbi:ArgP/LysG family DNA-binding transcriptional regulator [Microlunatus sp. Gsoil 973]|uniref:ArgP/LysG family DNA-binding transcriptional regulator n=1 Tax=Microlunatus sp. Gsoil 973 TaxID=2672569 RepID=UPI0012B48907|nr:ArgP/LysG family DNA-binding transcriptional regulator [Microlunatus sp. Gsoil 973]QGN34136.1 ArgP/LysG family DNA-binding transcriptional regulator [Microlunatus sp. Gsoil 973]